MINLSGSDPSGSEEVTRNNAKQIADQIAPLLRRSHVCGFDFLAYLLAMAVSEARRLAEK